MSSKPKAAFSFHNSNNICNLKPPPKQNKGNFNRNLADLNADELFDNFDDLFEVTVKENFNPETYRVDTHKTVIKDLTKKFNDMIYTEPTLKSQSPSEVLRALMKKKTA